VDNLFIRQSLLSKIMPFYLHHAQSMIDALETDDATKASMRRAFMRRLQLFGSDILFFKEPFTPISLTGTRCSLKCRHCDSHYLSHMLDGSDGKLHTHARLLKEKGAQGILLSGGSAADGSVPTYVQAGEILKIKQDTKLKISAHTGIVNGSQAQVLSDYLDMALVDVIGDESVLESLLACGLPESLTAIVPVPAVRIDGSSGRALNTIVNGPGQNLSINFWAWGDISDTTDESMDASPIMRGMGDAGGLPLIS